MKLISLLFISAASLAPIASANQPPVDTLKCALVENIKFYKQANHSCKDIHTFMTTYQTAKELVHQLGFGQINKKELEFLTTAHTYLEITKPVYNLIKNYSCDHGCQINFDAINKWINENCKKIYYIHQLIPYFSTCQF